MPVYTLHVFVDGKVLEAAPTNLCLSREVNGDMNTVFQAFSSSAHSADPLLRHKNTFQWTDEFEIAVTRSLINGTRPFDECRSWRILPGETSKWHEHDILPPRTRGHSLPHGAFEVSELPQHVCGAVKMNTLQPLSRKRYIHVTGHSWAASGGHSQFLAPSNNYLLFWSDHLGTEEMYTDPVNNAFVFSMDRGEKNLRYGYVVPNMPSPGELPVWHDYETLDVDRALYSCSHAREGVHGGSAADLVSTIYAPLQYLQAKHLHYAYLTGKFANETRQAILYSRHTLGVSLIRVCCEFQGSDIEKTRKISVVGMHLMSSISIGLSMHVEQVKKVLVFTVSLSSKPPGFSIVRGDTDSERVATLVSHQIQTISEAWRPSKVDIHTITTSTTQNASSSSNIHSTSTGDNSTKASSAAAISAKTANTSINTLTSTSSKINTANNALSSSARAVHSQSQQYHATHQQSKDQLNTTTLQPQPHQPHTAKPSALGVTLQKQSESTSVSLQQATRTVLSTSLSSGTEDKTSSAFESSSSLTSRAGDKVSGGVLENETEQEEHVVQPEEYEAPIEQGPGFWAVGRCHWPASTTFSQAAAGFIYITNALKRTGYIVEEKTISDTASGVIESHTTYGPGVSWQSLKRDWVAAVAADRQNDGHYIPTQCFTYLTREKTPEGNYITHEIAEGTKEWKQYLLQQTSPRSPANPFYSPMDGQFKRLPSGRYNEINGHLKSIHDSSKTLHLHRSQSAEQSAAMSHEINLVRSNNQRSDLQVGFQENQQSTKNDSTTLVSTHHFTLSRGNTPLASTTSPLHHSNIAHEQHAMPSASRSSSRSSYRESMEASMTKASTQTSLSNGSVTYEKVDFGAENADAGTAAKHETAINIKGSTGSILDVNMRRAACDRTTDLAITEGSNSRHDDYELAGHEHCYHGNQASYGSTGLEKTRSQTNGHENGTFSASESRVVVLKTAANQNQYEAAAYSSTLTEDETSKKAAIAHIECGPTITPINGQRIGGYSPMDLQTVTFDAAPTDQRKSQYAEDGEESSLVIGNQSRRIEEDYAEDVRNSSSANNSLAITVNGTSSKLNSRTGRSNSFTSASRPQSADGGSYIYSTGTTSNGNVTQLFGRSSPGENFQGVYIVEGEVSLAGCKEGKIETSPGTPTVHIEPSDSVRKRLYTAAVGVY